MELQGRTKLHCCMPVIAEFAVVALDIAAADADSDTVDVEASVKVEASPPVQGEEVHSVGGFVVEVAVVLVVAAVAAGTDRQ